MGYWSSETLKERIPAEKLILPYFESRVKRCAYEMGIGAEAFITSEPGGSPQLGPTDKVVVPPGQCGLLVTHEVVTVPCDAIAFISIRAGVKFRGLVNVSGFHVDPGFKGPLKFAVYNAGSQPIVLDQEEPVFLIWYCDLDDPTADLYPERPQTKSIITSEDVMKIQGDVASPAELKKKIDELKAGYDQRILSIEKEQNIVRALLIALIIVFLGIFIRWFFESKKESSPATDQPVSPPAAASTPKSAVPVVPASTQPKPATKSKATPP
jgi:dCTP deaminase